MKKILLLENDSASRLTFINLFRQAGFEVVVAANGKIAANKLQAQSISAVVLDPMLPGIRGKDLIRSLRTTPGQQDVPIFVCTSASRMEAWSRRALRAGATKIFDKSARSPDQIVDEVTRDLNGNLKGVDHKASSAMAAPRIETEAEKEKEPEKKTETTTTTSNTSPSPAPTALHSSKGILPVQETKQEVQPTSLKDKIMSPFNLFRKKPVEQPKQESTPAKPEKVAPDVPEVTAPEKTIDKAKQSDETTSQKREDAPPSEPVSKPSTEPAPSTAPEPTAKDATQSESSTKEVTTKETHSEVPVEKSPSQTPVKSIVECDDKSFSNSSGICSASQTAFFSAPSPIVCLQLDKSGGIFSENEGISNIFGWESTELAGKSIFELIKKGVNAKLDEFLNTLVVADGEAQPSFFAIGLNKDGSDFPAFVSFFRDENSEQEEWRVMLQKISQKIEKKPIQQKMLQLMGTKVNLERRLGEITKSRDGLLGLLRTSALSDSPNNPNPSLNTATNVTHEIENLVQVESERSKEYQREIERLQKAQEELNQKLTQEEESAAQSKQRAEELESKLRESNETVQRLEKQQAEQVAAHKAVESQLQTKLADANTAYGKLLKSYQEQSTKCLQSFDQLGELRKSREGMAAQLAEEQQKFEDSKRRYDDQERALKERTEELNRLKETLEKQVIENGKPETALCEKIESAQKEVERNQIALDEESAKKNTLEKQLTNLSKSHEELNAKLTQREQECQELRRRSEELESRLKASTDEMETVKQELTSKVQERDELESQLREKLKSAKADLDVVEADYQEHTSFHTRSNNEIQTLRQAQEELNTALATEREVAEESKRYVKQLEQQLQERSSELERIKEELDQQVAGRANLESEYNNLSEANAALKNQLSNERESHTKEAGAQNQPTSSGSNAGRLARFTAELDYERGQRSRAEKRAASATEQLKNLHEELRKHLEQEDEYQQKLNNLEVKLKANEEALTKAIADLQKETNDRQLAEDQLKSNEEISAQMKQHASALDEAKDLLRQSQEAQEEQEARLQESQRTLQQSESRLQKESAERQSLQEKLDEVQRTFKEQSQKNAHDLNKIKSTLQVERLERQRLESQILESRHSELKELRANRSSINGFRQQLQSPLDHLLQATRRLLESELATEDKALAQEALENAFILQESMDDSSGLNESEEPTPNHPHPTSEDSAKAA